MGEWWTGSPYGQHSSYTWQCLRCLAFGYRATFGLAREGGSQHVQATGHAVEVAGHTGETLAPVAAGQVPAEPGR